MTTTLRSVQHAACVVLVLGLVTCSAETPAEDADRLSKEGESVTAKSGVGPPYISAELVLKDLMLWMRDNHGLAPLLHPENSEWLEGFAPRGASGEQTVALSFALRSALSREMEKAAILQTGFDASSPRKAAETRPEASSCVDEREDTVKEIEDLRCALSSARAEADERQRALDEALHERKRALDEVRALHEASLPAVRDAEERFVADSVEDVDTDLGSESNSVAAVLEEDGADDAPEPVAETTDGAGPEPMAETADGAGPEPMAETADDAGPELMAETADGAGPEPMAESADDAGPEPMAETADGVEPDHSISHLSPPDEPSPRTDFGTDESTLRRIVGGIHAAAKRTALAVYPVLKWLAHWMMRSSLGLKLSRALDAAALKLETMASTVDAYLGTSLAYPGARFRMAVEVALAVAALVALLTLRWIARAWYNWTFKQQITPKDARPRHFEGTDALRGRTGVERSDGDGPVTGGQGFHSSATLRHRSLSTPQVLTPHVPTPTSVPVHHVSTQQSPTQWHMMPAGNAPPPRAVIPPGLESAARGANANFRASGPPPVQMRRGPPPRVNPVFKPHAS